jgi:broad specificity phosphatase PhoE
MSRVPNPFTLRVVYLTTDARPSGSAQILAGHLGLPVQVLTELGENDRSATGYLPKAEFEAVADEFFARPHESVRGWECAVDAQRRIVGAVKAVLNASTSGKSDIAIVAHGGVGTLLLCHLRGDPIGRGHDQPPNNGGNYFAFDAATRRVHHSRRAIDA